MRSLIVWLVFVGCGSPGLAQVVPLRVTRHECDQHNCQQFIASGSAVHLGRTHKNNQVFLTAAHNLAPISPNAILLESQQIELRVEKTWLTATLIRSGRTDGVDLALLLVRTPLPELRCLPLLKRDLRENESVYLAGYPKGADLRVIAGRVIRTEYINYPLAIDQQPIQGESGGAVVIDGKLAGIISGYPSIGQPVCLFADEKTIEEFVHETLRSDPLCWPR